MTGRLHFHFSLSCIGEGNGNPLQCSCLKNPRDSGAWWATAYGVAQSQTRLMRLSSSGSKEKMYSTKNAYKEKKAQINDLNSHLKNLERKEEQSKFNVYKQRK